METVYYYRYRIGTSFSILFCFFFLYFLILSSWAGDTLLFLSLFLICSIPTSVGYWYENPRVEYRQDLKQNNSISSMQIRSK